MGMYSHQIKPSNLLSRCVIFKLALTLLMPLYWLLLQAQFRANLLPWHKLRITATSNDQYLLSYTQTANWLGCKQPSWLREPLERSNGVRYHLLLAFCTHLSSLKIP